MCLYNHDSSWQNASLITIHVINDVSTGKASHNFSLVMRFVHSHNMTPNIDVFCLPASLIFDAIQF